MRSNPHHNPAASPPPWSVWRCSLALIGWALAGAPPRRLQPPTSRERAQ